MTGFAPPPTACSYSLSLTTKKSRSLAGANRPGHVEAAAEPSLARCHEPILFIQGTADKGIFPSDAQALFEAAGAEGNS